MIGSTNTLRDPRRGRSLRIGGWLGASALTIAVMFGCSSSEGGGKAAQICKPKTESYCRCADRAEGVKTCKDDGSGFSKCEPCETDENPEVPYEPGEEPDGSTPPEDAPSGDGSTTNPGCGDKIVQDGEDCDDGNKNETDGCNSKCKIAGQDPPATRSCPGLDVHLWSAPVVYEGTTTGSANSATSVACAAGSGATGSGAPDRIFKVTPHKAGTLKVETNTNFNAYLYVSSECKTTGANSTIACANASVSTTGGNETISIPVQAGTSYTVIADGASIQTPNAGYVKVTFTLQ